MRRALLLFATGLLLAGCVSSSGSSGGASDGGGVGNDPAYLLAKYDGALSELPTYSAALDEWQARCTEGRTALAGYVDAAYRDEQKNGGPEDDTSRLDVMRHLTASVPTSAGRMKCDDIAAAYLTLVETAD